MFNKLRALKDQAIYWPRAWGLIWNAAPRLTTAWMVLLIVQGALPTLTVYLTKHLVDSLTAAIAIGANWENMRPTIVLVAITAGSLLATEIVQGVAGWIRLAQSELVQDHIKGLIHDKSTSIDLAFFETPEYHDQLEQARSDAAGRPLALLENAGNLIQNGITLIAMAVLLVPYGEWLPLALLISTFPALYVTLRFDREYHKWWNGTTIDRRWVHYFDAVLTEAMIAPEIRLFGLSKHFRSLYQARRQRLRTERMDLTRRQSLGKLAAGFVALLISGITMGWMVLRAAQGFVTLGDLAMFYQAFQRGQGLLRTLLGSLGQVYSNTLFLGNLFKFLDFEKRLCDPPVPVPPPSVLKHGIGFRHVTFRYPGSDHNALEDLNLDFPADRVTAIVGPNGAGKSSLLKLLCRFYDPLAGGVEADGTDIRCYSLDEWRRMITVLFQFPIGYITTASENILLGDPKSVPDTSRIEIAARNAGAHELITQLPLGYDTILGKAFSGVELSGGEWQRIAMARAFHRQAPVIVLDEPTSHMDSWAEAEWFERFRALSRGRTAIIVTHRFTIAMRADIIHVMNKGQIVESGSHHELLAHGGMYADSWRTQMRAAASDDGLSSELKPIDTSSLDRGSSVGLSKVGQHST